MNEKRIDFAIFRLGLFPIVEYWFEKRYKIPIVIKTLEDLDSLRIQKGIHGIVGKTMAPLDNALVRAVASRALAIDVSTPEFIDYHKKHLDIEKEKVMWIDNAVSTDRFFPADTKHSRAVLGLKDYNPIIGYIGGKPYDRGGRQMIDILPRLLKDHPCAGAVIVGGGDKMEELKKRAHRLNVAHQCVFPGMVSYEQAPRYINAFDVGMAFDSCSRTKLFGNSSQKIRQYVACGKPVIAGEGGNLFLEKDSLGSIVLSDDLNAIYNSVHKWISQTATERNDHSRKAYNYAKINLSVETMLNRRLDFWNRRLSEAGF